MKLTNQLILNSIEGLSAISKREFPIKVSYAISKNIKKINEELITYNEQRQKLVTKYAICDENGKTILDENNIFHIKEEFVEVWNKELKELFAIENDIDISKFPLKALTGFNISASDIGLIDYMIEE